MSDILLPAPVQAMIDAINAGDTDAFVAAFTADGFVSDWGTVKAGADGVRGWADSDAIGAGARMTVLSAATDGRHDAHPARVEQSRLQRRVRWDLRRRRRPARQLHDPAVPLTPRA